MIGRIALVPLVLLVGYGGRLLYQCWKFESMIADVPDGLQEFWGRVESVIRLWPVLPAVVALGGAAYVFFAQ